MANTIKLKVFHMEIALGLQRQMELPRHLLRQGRGHYRSGDNLWTYMYGHGPDWKFSSQSCPATA